VCSCTAMILWAKHVGKRLIIIENGYYDTVGAGNLYVPRPSNCTDFTTCLTKICKGGSTWHYSLRVALPFCA
jgi:hypothetical protein